MSTTPWAACVACNASRCMRKCRSPESLVSQSQWHSLEHLRIVRGTTKRSITLIGMAQLKRRQVMAATLLAFALSFPISLPPTRNFFSHTDSLLSYVDSQLSARFGIPNTVPLFPHLSRHQNRTRISSTRLFAESANTNNSKSNPHHIPTRSRIRSYADRIDNPPRPLAILRSTCLDLRISFRITFVIYLWMERLRLSVDGTGYRFQHCGRRYDYTPEKRA